ncbi:hypothetical protein ACWXVJ_02060 [Mycoplasma sp. 773]
MIITILFIIFGLILSTAIITLSAFLLSKKIKKSYIVSSYCMLSSCLPIWIALFISAFTLTKIVLLVFICITLILIIVSAIVFGIARIKVATQTKKEE